MSDFPFREKSFPFRENGHIALSQVSPMSDFPFRETRHIGHGRGGQHRKRGNTMTDPEAWLRGQLAQRANRYALQMERLLGSSNGAEPDDDGLGDPAETLAAAVAEMHADTEGTNDDSDG